MRVRSLASMSLVAMAAAVFSSTARADDASDARDLFARGRELRSHGDCAGAVPIFRKAYEVYPAGLGSLRNLASCQASLGLFASARRSWLQLKTALVSNGDAKYARWDEDADREAARLEPKVSRLAVEVAVVDGAGTPASPGGVSVTVDAQVLDAASLGEAVERDPGGYVVRASGDGVVGPAEDRGELAPGETKRVALRLVLAPSAPQPVAAVPPAAEPPPSVEGHPSTARRAIAWTAVGVGAAGIAAAAVSLGMRQSALSDLEHACPLYASGSCDASTRAAVDSATRRGETASALLYVFGAVGLAGATAGITLFATERAGTISVVASPTSIAARGRF